MPEPPNKSYDLAFPHHIAFADWMRHHVQDHRYRPDVIISTGWEEMRWHVWSGPAITTVPWISRIINTTHLSSTEVASKVLSWINHHLRLSTQKRQAP